MLSAYIVTLSLTLFDRVQKLHRTFPLFSIFDEMLYAFDHLAKYFVEQSHSFLHPRFLLYPCDGAIGHVEMFDEMFDAFDHPRSNIKKFWLFFQLQCSVKCSASLTGV